MRLRTVPSWIGAASAALLLGVIVVHDSRLGTTPTWVASEHGVVLVRADWRRSLDTSFELIRAVLLALSLMWLPGLHRGGERLYHAHWAAICSRWQPAAMAHAVSSWIAAAAVGGYILTLDPYSLRHPAPFFFAWVFAPLWAPLVVVYTPLFLRHQHVGNIYAVIFTVTYLVSVVLVLRSLVAKAVRLKRASENCCITCGYDLRESPDRCPECGTASPPRRE